MNGRVWNFQIWEYWTGQKFRAPYTNENEWGYLKNYSEYRTLSTCWDEPKLNYKSYLHKNKSGKAPKQNKLENI